MFVGVQLYESFLCRCLVLYNMINNFTGHETLHYTLCACTPCTLHWRSVLCLYDIHSPIILNWYLTLIIVIGIHHSKALSFICIIVHWHYHLLALSIMSNITYSASFFVSYLLSLCTACVLYEKTVPQGCLYNWQHS